MSPHLYGPAELGLTAFLIVAFVSIVTAFFASAMGDLD